MSDSDEWPGLQPLEDSLPPPPLVPGMSSTMIANDEEQLSLIIPSPKRHSSDNLSEKVKRTRRGEGKRSSLIQNRPASLTRALSPTGGELKQPTPDYYVLPHTAETPISPPANCPPLAATMSEFIFIDGEFVFAPSRDSPTPPLEENATSEDCLQQETDIDELRTAAEAATPAGPSSNPPVITVGDDKYERDMMTKELDFRHDWFERAKAMARSQRMYTPNGRAIPRYRFLKPLSLPFRQRLARFPEKLDEYHVLEGEVFKYVDSLAEEIRERISENVEKTFSVNQEDVDELDVLNEYLAARENDEEKDINEYILKQLVDQIEADLGKEEKDLCGGAGRLEGAMTVDMQPSLLSMLKYVPELNARYEALQQREHYIFPRRMNRQGQVPRNERNESLAQTEPTLVEWMRAMNI